MPINRFYTPQLPEYTSQFVEDRTPWSEMLAMEENKLGRSERTLGMAADMNAQMKSLMPGYRTPEVADEVVKDYGQRVNKIMEEHGDSLYSIPAMRAITNLNAEFQGDPRVKLVKQDYEANKIRDEITSRPGYRKESDPNIDPATGELRKFKSTEIFAPYQASAPYVDINEDLDKAFSRVTEASGTDKLRTFEQDGVLYSEVSNWSRKDPKLLEAEARRQAQAILTGQSEAANYLRSITPEEDWNEEYILNNVVNPAKEKWSAVQRQTHYAPIPASSRKGTDEGGSIGSMEVNVRGMATPKRDNLSDVGEEAKGAIGKIRALISSADEKKLDRDYDKGVYNEIMSDPEKILSNPNTASYIREALSIDYDGTERMMNDYFIKKEEELNNAPNQNSNDIKNQKRFLEKNKKYFDSIKEKIEKEMATPFKNDFEYNEAINAAVIANEFGKKGVPFNSYDEMIKMTPEKMRASHKIYLNKTKENIRRIQENTVGYMKAIPFSQEMSKELSSMFGGLPVSNDGVVSGTLEANSTLPVALGGQRMMRYNTDKREYEELKDSQRTALLNSGNPFYIDAGVVDSKSLIGSGMLHMVVADKKRNKYDYWIEAPEPWASRHKLETSAYSYKIPSNLGEGNIFTVTDAYDFMTNKPLNETIIGVNDMWDKNKYKGAEDVHMKVRQNSRSGNVELVVFKGDPKQKGNETYLKNIYEDPKDGYHIITVGRAGEEISPENMKYAVVKGFFLGNDRKYEGSNRYENILSQIEDAEAAARAEWEKNMKESSTQ